MFGYTLAKPRDYSLTHMHSAPANATEDTLRGGAKR